MSKKLDLLFAWVGAVALLVLHHDFWRGERSEILFGFLPEELGYRVLWMVAAWIYLLFFTARIWKGERS